MRLKINNKNIKFDPYLINKKFPDESITYMSKTKL